MQISGGLARGRAAGTAVLFDPLTLTFAPAYRAADDRPRVDRVVAVLPADQGTDVPVDTFIALRLSTPIDGQTAALTNKHAAWTFNVPKPVTATVTVKSSTGQTVYSGSFSMNPGMQTFEWDGRDANGTQWPDGNYTISVTAKDANGQTVSIPSEIEGVVDSVDVSKTPPELSVGGQSFTLDKIKRVVRPRASSSES